MHSRPEQYISGADIRYYLRVNRITIRTIARHMQITLKRVREVCAAGCAGAACTDWMEAIHQLRKDPKP